MISCVTGVPLSARQRRVLSAGCSQRGADGGDDGAAERYGDERAQEAGAEEPPANPGERQQFERYHREREQHRDVVLRDEERQRVQDTAETR